MKATGAARALWRGLRADRVALAAGIFLVALVLACFAGAPVAAWALGHGPNQYFAYGAYFGSNSQLDPAARAAAAGRRSGPPTAARARAD